MVYPIVLAVAAYEDMGRTTILNWVIVTLCPNDGGVPANGDVTERIP